MRLAREEPLLVSAPDEARRAEFAALWKALNTSPENLRESMALLDKLQGEAAAQVRQAEAEKAGWSGGSVEKYCPGKCIGGSRFGNYEGTLPEKDGRTYTDKEYFKRIG